MNTTPPLPIEEQYWGDYAHNESRRVFRCVELTCPTQAIDEYGQMAAFESGDFAICDDGTSFALRRAKFRQLFRPVSSWDCAPRKIDLSAYAINAVEEVRDQMRAIDAKIEKLYLIYDGAQK